MHSNNGKCQECDLIFKRHPGFNINLWDWFLKIQKTYPESHISCAGRGRIDQEELFLKGASRAHWKESAHNYNAAIDIFRQTKDGKTNYDVHWFADIIEPFVEDWIVWFGDRNRHNRFFELPHFQLYNFMDLAKKGTITLVEKDTLS